MGGTQSGPLGANLFVYHLPKRFTDRDLFALFSRIGNILSAKVYVDKQTHESKCFGFVSYQFPYEASMAIKQLNGFQVQTLTIMSTPNFNVNFNGSDPKYMSNVYLKYWVHFYILRKKYILRENIFCAKIYFIATKFVVM